MNVLLPKLGLPVCLSVSLPLTYTTQPPSPTSVFAVHPVHQCLQGDEFEVVLWDYGPGVPIPVFNCVKLHEQHELLVFTECWGPGLCP